MSQILKTCTSCNKDKTLDKFHKHKTGQYGRCCWCKVCRSSKRKTKKNPRPKSGKFYCPKCQQNLDVSEFHADKSSDRGIQTYCKKCGKENTTRWASTFDGYITRLFKDLKNNAMRRNIKVSITKQDIKDQYLKQNGLCALTRKKMTHYGERNNKRLKKNLYNISVDRIDSKKGYFKDNIQLVCNIINIMKWDFKQNDFIEMCRIVANCNLQENNKRKNHQELMSNPKKKQN